MDIPFICNQLPLISISFVIRFAAKSSEIKSAHLPYDGKKLPYSRK